MSFNFTKLQENYKVRNEDQIQEECVGQERSGDCAAELNILEALLGKAVPLDKNSLGRYP